MTIKNGTPLSWFPQGLSDCLDSTPVFPGAMSALQNLIPDQSTKNIWTCRPASTLAVDFSKTGGAFNSAFSSAFDIGYANSTAFISLLLISGQRAYGMVSSKNFPGFDVPFSFNLVSGTFDPITGITSSNIPASPATSGAWTPPTADVIGTNVVVTHPGFNGGGNGYFGTLNISTLAAPAWKSGNTASTALAAVPVAVKNFNQRAWYLVNPPGGAQPGAYYSDVLASDTVTAGTQILTFDDNAPLTALGALPLNNQLGGIIQALIVFKGASNTYQVTGDAAASPSSTLARNALNIATGTLAPLSICPTPRGLAFMAPDGVRVIDFTARVSDVIGLSGAGISVPFTYAVVPSRVCAACNMSVIRLSVQNGNMASNPTQEYWYDMARESWSGPHSFPASLIEPYTNTFIMSPVGVLSKLFNSQSFQSLTSTFTENGSVMSFSYRTAPLPNTGQIASNFISETTVDMAKVAGSSYTVVFTNQQNTVVDTVTVSQSGVSDLWGAFNWGAANWGTATSVIAPQKINWNLPLVIDQGSLQVTGTCEQGVKFGKVYLRYSVLGYLANAA